MLPGSDTQHITSLLGDAHPHALAFYDRVGARGTSLPWRMYRKDSIPREVWDSKVPKWFDVLTKTGEDGEKIFECEGKEFRFFEDPASVLDQITQDAINHNPSCRYMPGVRITRMEPIVTTRRFGNRSSTHVQWLLYGTNQNDGDSHSARASETRGLDAERPLLRTKQVIFATGASFLDEASPTAVPELEYMFDALKVSRGSVIDLESDTTPFEPIISQQNMVLSPLSPIESDGSETSTQSSKKFRARLGSTQRIIMGDEELAAEELLNNAKAAFPDLPQDARIVGMRTGERTYRANRLPIVGGLLDPFGALKLFPNAVHGSSLPLSAPRLSGLYFIGGMGSRGFTLAPLLSRMLVEQLLGPFDTRVALGSSRSRFSDHSHHNSASKSSQSSSYSSNSSSSPISDSKNVASKANSGATFSSNVSNSSISSQSSFNDSNQGENIINVDEKINHGDISARMPHAIATAPDNVESLKAQWWPKLMPRRVLTAWLRRVRPSHNYATPEWSVNWPQLIGSHNAFPEDFQEAKDSFDVIPTSWDPNRTHFETTYCPLFDDDHTRD